MLLKTLVAERDSLPLHSAILPKNDTELSFRDLTLIQEGRNVKVFYELTGNLAGSPVFATCVQDFDQDCEVDEVAALIAKRIGREAQDAREVYLEKFALC